MPKVVHLHAASLNQQDNPLNPLTDFHSLSLRDLLEARDLYHLHLTERKGVVATAVLLGMAGSPGPGCATPRSCGSS